LLDSGNPAFFFCMYQVLLHTHEAYILPTVLMLARALERKGVPLVRSPLHWRPARAAAKIVGGFNIRRLPIVRRQEPVFCQLDHAEKNAFYPYVLRHPLVTYTFDCWPFIYDEWQKVFELNKPKIAFISAQKSVEEMRRRVTGVDFRWLPEAGDPASFDGSACLAHRPIDVLELGRSYPVYHDGISNPLAVAGYYHRFPSPGNPVSLTYEKAIAAFAASKIVVCFPKSITDPARAGNVETTTFRYFESIFSKCLIIGHCPAELIEVMGYNPVIEADLNRPADQLIAEVLPRIQDYQSLVERNYQTLASKWTVEHQAAKIVAALSETVTIG
jgi:hypothetical protein